MHLNPESFRSMIQEIGKLCAKTGVKSAGGRVMLIAELLLSLFLVLILSLSFGHKIIITVIASLRNEELTPHADHEFMVTLTVITISLVLVFIREVIEIKLKNK